VGLRNASAGACWEVYGVPGWRLRSRECSPAVQALYSSWDGAPRGAFALVGA
jgi:hypothetical protein